MFILGLFWPLLLLGIVVYVIRKRGQSIKSDWFELIAQSRDDLISQVFITLSVVFAGIAIYAINRDLGTVVDWQWILFVSVIAGLCVGYYYQNTIAFVLSLIGVFVWWIAQSTTWINLGAGSEMDIRPMGAIWGMVLISAIYYVLGHLHQEWDRYKKYGVVYIFGGLITVTTILFILSTQAGLESLDSITKGMSIFESWPLVVSLGLLVLILASVVVWSVVKKQIILPEVLMILFVVGLLGSLLFISGKDIFVSTSNDLNSWDWSASSRPNLTYIGLMWAVVFNVLLLAELLGLILLGYIRHRIWLINFGAIALFIFVIVKYFDWFFTFLDKSVFFIGAGILFFAVGVMMERGRRYMVEKADVD